MEVRHGVLLNVHGRPLRHGDYAFMPAHVELDGGSYTLDYRLGDRVDDSGPPALLAAISGGFDAAWVRARIPAVFGFTPEPTEIEKTLLQVGFVAVTEGGAVCYPFLCTDHYGRSALAFSDEGPEEFIKRSIAEEFWRSLVQGQAELADFEDRVLHSGAMVWLDYGCESGRVYCVESPM